MSRSSKAFRDLEVKAVFRALPSKLRPDLMCLRQLIFDTAASLKQVGELEEVLRWGDPSYLTRQSESGSIIRINRKRGEEGKYAIYFHCQTGLIATFKRLYSEKFIFEGKRALVFEQGQRIPIKALSHCIALALTYHLEKRALP